MPRFMEFTTWHNGFYLYLFFTLFLDCITGFFQKPKFTISWTKHTTRTNNSFSMFPPLSFKGKLYSMHVERSQCALSVCLFFRMFRVEPTNLQELPLREARVADPQMMLVYGSRPEDIESAFFDGPYSPVTMPFNRRYLKPALPTNRRYVEPAGGLQRQFLQQFFTVTRRSTVFELAISTVTPTCSEPGRIQQCPVEKKKTIDKINGDEQ